MSKDSYFTIHKPSIHEIKIKGSRFIGHVKSVQERNKAERFITKISKKHHAATHNCFAYHIGIGSQIQSRFNDDGEPSGTAGRPILETISGRDLTNVVCVVTRYFGGTKLGTGGLARAYSQCAAEVLDKAGRKEHHFTISIELVFPYDCTGNVMSLLSARKIQITNKTYNALATITIDARQSIINKLQQDLINATSGKIQMKVKENDSR